MAHAKGSNFRLVGGWETDFNTLPDAPRTALVLPVNSCGLKADQPLRQPGTMTGRRDPAEPYAGFVACSGDITVPLEAASIGFFLKGLLGAPTTAQAAAKNIDSGSAVDLGSGLVGIPAAAHGIADGVTVTIAGTTNYNGDHVLHASTTANQLVITATFVSESFSGATARPKLYTHVFKVQDEQPSFWLEKQFPDVSLNEVFTGDKVSKFGFSVGGDGELVVQIGVEACNALEMLADSVASNAGSLAMARFLFDGAYLYEAGALFGRCTEFSGDIATNLDTDVYPLGNGAMRGALPEGTMGIGGRMKTMFTDAAILEKGRAHTETSLKLRFARAIESLELEFQEAQYSRTSVPVNTPKGLYAEVDWQAYYGKGAANSAMVATLINQVASY